MLNHTLTWNGVRSDSLGVKIEHFPAMNRPNRKYSVADVPGRNGNIYEFQPAFEEVEQSYQIFAGGKNKNSMREFIQIMEWLHSADGYAVLRDTYDPEHYRKAVYVDATDVENSWLKYGRAVITFRCRPERYIDDAEKTLEFETGFITDTARIWNPTNHIAKPLIHLVGPGASSQIKTTGNTVVQYNTTSGAYSISDVPIADGCIIYGVNKNYTAYNYFNVDNVATPSDGTLTFTNLESQKPSAWGVGISVKVDGNAQYTVSGTCPGGSITVALFGSNGQLQTSIKGDSEVLTFTTLPDTYYAMIVFYGDPEQTNVVWTEIMLTGGSEPKPYKQYYDLWETRFTLNGTRMTITQEFADLYIDCDTEEITGDGLNFNRFATFDFQNGADQNFFRLMPGENIITKYSMITDVTLDARFWEV